ncbi:MAG: tetratricopeptide repeat protein [Desulfobacteraceae bacterium]|nr:tetratricopeptide repeat protein [Desulfobacteraceae bacterium]
MDTIGGIYYNTGKFDLAEKTWKDALKLKLDYAHANINFGLATLMAIKGEFEKAIEYTENALEIYPEKPDYHNQKGFFLLRSGKNMEAISNFSIALKNNPHHYKSLINIGMAFNAIGYHRKAFWYLNKAHHIDKTDILPILCLIQISSQLGDNNNSDEWARKLFALIDHSEISSVIKELSNSYLTVPVSFEQITPVILRQFSLEKQVLTNAERDLTSD